MAVPLGGGAGARTEACFVFLDSPGSAGVCRHVHVHRRVHVCMCLRVQVCMCAGACTCVCVHAYVCTGVYVQVCASMCRYVQACVCVCTCALVRRHGQVYVCRRVHACTCVCRRVHARAQGSLSDSGSRADLRGLPGTMDWQSPLRPSAASRQTPTSCVADTQPFPSLPAQLGCAL